MCLNILREDWKPVLTINSNRLRATIPFLEPNPEDPLNKEAAQELQSNRKLFEANVQKDAEGAVINGSTSIDAPAHRPTSQQTRFHRYKDIL